MSGYRPPSPSLYVKEALAKRKTQTGTIVGVRRPDNLSLTFVIKDVVSSENEHATEHYSRDAASLLREFWLKYPKYWERMLAQINKPQSTDPYRDEVHRLPN